MLTPVLIGGCLIIMISFAIRASFGIFQIPIAEEFGWLRAEFSLAIAIQNLAWGVGQPIFGAIAERFGDRRAHRMLGMSGADDASFMRGLVRSRPMRINSPPAPACWKFLVGVRIAGTGFRRDSRHQWVAPALERQPLHGA